ncbi:MAG: hypothetical protein LUE87_05410, partial [Lachnospiraceae bacterium]|nr:hypothetical protein [Lachnospiraceae bacterium]
MMKLLTRKDFMKVTGMGAAALGIASLTGCGSSDSSSDTSSSTSSRSESAGEAETAEEDFSDNVTISAWVHTFDNDYGYMDTFNDNPVVAYLSEKFNTTFEWQIPATGSESESFSLMIGSGDYTNVFYTAYSQQTPDELYEDGVIIDLSEYMDAYMPNLTAFLETDETARKNMYNDDGKVLYLPVLQNEASTCWGGLIYNRQILVDMTDDNIQFPSGNDEPTTVEDWEYMFGLMKEYFDGMGYTDYACLIIPYNGWFTTGDILTGFGTTGAFYVDDNGNVQNGIISDEFYNYLVKMKEWYQKGYIYQDFASRSSDPFYWPNTALTYGCVAGVFYGLTSQLGTTLSMADYGMNVDYYAIAAPVDTENNVTPLEANSMVQTAYDYNIVSYGWAVSENCNEDQ